MKNIHGKSQNFPDLHNLVRVELLPTHSTIFQSITENFLQNPRWPLSADPLEKV